MKGVIICLLVSAFAIGILLLVILLPVSIKSLGLTEVGIRYHTITRNLDDKSIYGQGRYVLKPGEKFFKFNNNFQTLFFVSSDSEAINDISASRNFGPIWCLSQDGLSILLSVSVQYQLKLDKDEETGKNKLYLMFRKFGLNYEKVYIAVARSSIRDACGRYKAQDFYNNRQGIQETMLNLTTFRFEPLYADAGFLQLLTIQFPSQYARVIEETQVAISDVERAKSETAAALTQSKTLVLNAEQDAIITVVQANSTAQATIQSATIEAISISNAIYTKQLVYSSIQSQFGFTPQELINYIQIENMKNYKTVTVSVPQAPAAYAFGTNGTAL